MAELWDMIEIKDINGSTLKSVPITQECKLYEELMSMCYITLSWEDESNTELPAGSYIEYEGKTYRLLEPYEPTYINESSWKYTPQFYDKIAEWSKKPLFLVTDSGEETDWSLTAYPGQFMEAVVAAILKYTGETYTYSVDASIAQLSMQNVVFQNSSIFDGLTKIADAWKTEWWVSGNVIHLSKCQYGTSVELTVGDNIGIPTVTKHKDGYFTRFYAFGGTRNITQDYNDTGFTNGLVNKRLILNPSDYPGGYIDIKPNLQNEEIFVKTLIFDDIYPSSELVISGVRGELKDFLDESGNKIQVGEDAEGNPLYQQYSIWYFKIDDFEFNNSTYDKEENPNGMLLPGLSLSVSFESGQLNGRDFELIYHEDTKEYEIKYITEGTLIIPGTVSLIPSNGDKIILYNIKMPSEYTESAQERLADALLVEIDKYKKDRNSYTFPSASDRFYENNLDMSVGMAVTFVRGSQSLSTRVLKVEKQLDFPIEQIITVGEERIKGNTQEIKEEVIDANQNIDVVKSLADLNKSITEGYGRVQQLIIQSMSQYQGMWKFNYNGYPNDPTKWFVETPYTAVSQKDVIAFGADPEITDIGFPIASYTSLGAVSIKQGGGLVIDGNGQVSIDPNFTGGGLDENDLQEYLTERHYLTPTGLLYGYVQNTENPLITASDSVNEAFKKLENKLLSIDGDYVTLTTDQTITGQKTFEKTVISKADVVAYAAGSIEDLAAIATTTTYGLIKYDGSVFTTNASGQLTLTDGAGGGLTNVVSSGSGNAVTELSYNKETKVLTWTKGSIFALRSEIPTIPTAIKNPYSLSWSGYSSGSYDGSSAKSISIPNNTNQLTNGAGFITGITKSMVMNVLNGTKIGNYFLDGTGTFSTITTSDISGLSGEYVTISTDQTVTGTKWFTARTTIGPKTNAHILLGYGSGNCINAYDASEAYWNLYFNYRSSSEYTRVDPNNNFVTSGDIVAYATSSNISDIVAIATSTSYGVVKYDGDTLRVNSSGQLYVASGGGGGSGSVAWSDITGKPSWIGSNKPSYSWSEITSKPSWIGSSKPSYTWSEIGSKPSGLVTYVSISGSGNAVVNASFSSGTLTLTKGTISSGGSSWDTNRFRINSNGGSLFKSTGTMFTPTHSDSRASETGVEFYNNQVRGVHISYSSNYYVNNLYLNYVNSSKKGVLIDGSGKLTSYGNSTWSDMRLKDYISDITAVLPFLLRINVFRYKMKGWIDSPVLIGVSAQSVLPVFPEVVSSDDEGYYSVDYSKLSLLSFVGIRELYQKHLSLENLVKSRQHWELTKDEQIKHLQDTVIRLQNEINELKGEAA